MSRPIFTKPLIVLTTLLFTAQAVAASCTVASGPGRAALLELYTSEGCSSCPPADGWVSRLASQGFSDRQLIPLALHVDYWDYIGWQDRFAKPMFSDRQRAGAGAGFVYTPQVMLNGQDFRGWQNASRFEEAIAAINRMPPQANIKLTLNQAAADSFGISIVAQTTAQANVYLALYENGLTTQVKAGENSGATLHHDYVVREWLGPYPADGKAIQQKLALKSGWKQANMGVAAFVQDHGGQVLQAVATKLCN